jgi:uncharacterized membrane protein YgcG
MLKPETFMKRALIAVLFALCATGLYAQCNSVVIDQAGVLKDPTSIERAANALINQGADVHVVTVSNVGQYGGHLQNVEDFYERQCSNWKAPDGVRKGNLFVFMVAPSERMKNVFFGSSYTDVFPKKDNVDSLYSKYANPLWSHKQWDDGFVAALNGFGSAVAAFHDEQKHPAQTTVTQQATDLAPVASVFKWLLFILVCGSLIGLIIWLFRKRKQTAEATVVAQRMATQAQGRAADLFLKADKTNPGYGGIAERYTQLSNSVSFDPSQTGQSADTYNAIAAQWNSLANDILDLTRPTRPAASAAAAAPQQAPQARAAEPIVKTKIRHTVPHHEPHRHVRPVEEEYAPTPVYTPPVIVPAPIIIEEPEREVYREPEPVREERSYRNDDDDDNKKGSGNDSVFDALSNLGGSGNDSIFSSGGDSGGSGNDTGF